MAERLIREGGFGAVVGSDLVSIDVKERTERIVMPARGLSRPHQGADEQRIYLHANAGPIPGNSSAGIVSVRFDGSDRRDHVSVAGPGIYSQRTSQHHNLIVGEPHRL